MSESAGWMTVAVSAAMLDACHEAIGPPSEGNMAMIGAFVLGYEAATKRLPRERDEARAEARRLRAAVEAAQAAMEANGLRESKHTPASAITGLAVECDSLEQILLRIRSTLGCAEGEDVLAHAERLTRERDEARAYISRIHEVLGVPENGLAMEIIHALFRCRAALEEIAAGGCRTQHLNIDPVCRPTIPREEWCEGCVAAEALEVKP